MGINDGPEDVDGSIEGKELTVGTCDGTPVSILTEGPSLRDGVTDGGLDGDELPVGTKLGSVDGSKLNDGAIEGFSDLTEDEGPCDRVGTIDGPEDVDGLLEGIELTVGALEDNCPVGKFDGRALTDGLDDG